MTTLTPQQMRELAGQLERTLGKHPLPVENAVSSTLRAAADEVDRLRIALKGAPHSDGCMLGTRSYRPSDAPSFRMACTCWKADAL